MKITSIKQQVKHQDRYSLYVDGAYSFSLNETQLLSSGLHSGQEIDAAQLSQFKEESTTGKLFDRILNLLSIRPRSVWEVREYLRHKAASAEQIDDIVQRIQKLGYLNDERFTHRWVESRRLSKPTSQRKLRSELLAKRIAPDIIDRALAEDRQQTDETQVLRELLAKKRIRYSDDTKLMQFLARQGFRYGDIKSALQEHTRAESQESST